MGVQLGARRALAGAAACLLVHVLVVPALPEPLATATAVVALLLMASLLFVALADLIDRRTP